MGGEGVIHHSKGKEKVAHGKKKTLFRRKLCTLLRHGDIIAETAKGGIVRKWGH